MPASIQETTAPFTQSTPSLPTQPSSRPATPTKRKRAPTPPAVAYAAFGQFPRNADLYPDKDTALPAGLTDQEICARYPNHLSGSLMLAMLHDRSFSHANVYDNMPVPTKRDRNADLKVLRSRMYAANGRRALGLRRTKAQMLASVSDDSEAQQQFQSVLAFDEQTDEDENDGREAQEED